ncbi:Unannotated [Lentimonas sp. CC4]|nr:Unannotated [Lentimonas sp. CC4]CAA6686871.1 Unannotated [Lentimonas sp. CC6]CAA7074572.1 Unannotated [Lentimonas sp. CC4]CAA7169188.1 Unannotated [Lentimonas sp. CC21]CAA7180411.1 Unannotated [Lentimonas sp. CC8]
MKDLMIHIIISPQGGDIEAILKLKLTEEISRFQKHKKSEKENFE